MKNFLGKLKSFLLEALRIYIVICSLPFLLIGMIVFYPWMIAAAILFGLMCFVILISLILLYFLSADVVHWLSLTEVFEIHPFISYFCLASLFAGILGTCFLFYQYVRNRSDPEENPDPRDNIVSRSFLSWSQFIESQKK